MIFWALMHRKECKNDELEDVAEMRWEDGEETPHLSVYFYIVVCYPLLTKRYVLKQKEKYAEQAAKESVDRSASVRCLDDNTQALVYRLALIESAQRELIMTTFDMSDGESGQDLMAAMLQAADRGVRIRLMVDGINAWLKLEKIDLFCSF